MAKSYDPTMCKIHSKIIYICSAVDLVLQFVQKLDYYEVLNEDFFDFDRLQQWAEIQKLEQFRNFKIQLQDGMQYYSPINKYQK